MTWIDLRSEFGRVKWEAFRLQRLQRWRLATGYSDHAETRLPAAASAIDAHRNIGDYAAVGRRVYEIRIVEWPLDRCAQSALADIPLYPLDGSETFMVDEAAHPILSRLTEDFWLFDEQRVAVMHYDDEGRFVGTAEPIAPVEAYIARRDLAMKYAMLFEHWMANHRDRLTG